MGRVVFVLCWLFSFARLEAATLADQTVVVCNAADVESAQLAEYYAKRRDIPASQIVSLTCPLTEEISREEYNRCIAEPLRAKFDEQKWWTRTSENPERRLVTENRIQFVALMRGVPLKVGAVANPPGDKLGPEPFGQRNEASVDAELANLAMPGAQLSGPANNPYFKAYGRFGGVTLSQMMLVCRLDAPAVADVRRMIDDSLRAEKEGLSGWAVLDARGTAAPGYKEGDDWIFAAASKLEKTGIPIFEDRIEPILPAALPLPETAFYLGWYAGDFSGAVQSPGFRFAPGAVACHIHSYSASSLRSPAAGWVGPLASHGAAAVLGNVYEPYLTFTAHLDIFTDRLLRGFTFAESAWASLPAISWMSVNVGDPLYRPYANVNSNDALAAYRKSSVAGVVDYSTGPLAEAWAQQKAANGDIDEADFLFQTALQKYQEPDDLARVAWSYGQLLIGKGEKWRAIALARSTRGRMPGAGAANFLTSWLAEMEPPPATPPPSR